MNKTLEKAKEKQDYLFEEISQLLGALASPVRLRIIHFLSQAPHSVEQLSVKIKQSIANTSMHLKKMQRENILKMETHGQKRVYSLAKNEMKDFWETIQNFSQVHNSQNSLRSSGIYPEEIDWKKDDVETAKLIKEKKIILLDVRPIDEVLGEGTNYDQYVKHIPYDEIKKSYSVLDTKKPILVFCRGRLCVMSSESTLILRKLGFNAYKFDLSWHQLSNLLR